MVTEEGIVLFDETRLNPKKIWLLKNFPNKYMTFEDYDLMKNGPIRKDKDDEFRYNQFNHSYVDYYSEYDRDRLLKSYQYHYNSNSRRDAYRPNNNRRREYDLFDRIYTNEDDDYSNVEEEFIFSDEGEDDPALRLLKDVKAMQYHDEMLENEPYRFKSAKEVREFARTGYIRGRRSYSRRSRNNDNLYFNDDEVSLLDQIEKELIYMLNEDNPDISEGFVDDLMQELNEMDIENEFSDDDDDSDEDVAFDKFLENYGLTEDEYNNMTEEQLENIIPDGLEDVVYDDGPMKVSIPIDSKFVKNLEYIQ